MVPDFEEQQSLHGSHIGRLASPYIEAATAAAIEAAFKELIESKHLYQKVRVDLDLAIKQLKEWSDKLPPSVPGTGYYAGQHDGLIYGGSAYLTTLRSEIEARPWLPATRHLGDDPGSIRVHGSARVGGQALGVSNDERNIHFYFPPVRLMCKECKGESLFSAHVSSAPFSVSSLFPRKNGQHREQIYQPVFRCETCRRAVYTVLVRRSGPQLHLCGFAPRRPTMPSRAMPKVLCPILADAEQAIAEGDVSGAFYHLRTLLEHYVKDRLKLQLTEQMRGEELIGRHYDSLDKKVRPVLASLTEVYATLSERLHARTGKAEDFVPLRDKICDHIEMLALFERQMPNTAQ